MARASLLVIALACFWLSGSTNSQTLAPVGRDALELLVGTGPLHPPTPEFENCGGSISCQEKNVGDTDCGLSRQGWCTPVVSICIPPATTNCGSNVANRCIPSLFGTCEPPVTPLFVQCDGVMNLGQCNPGYEICPCVDLGIPDQSNPCDRLKHDCL